jgi:hypothetical protein
VSGADVLNEGGGVCLRRRAGGEDLVVGCGVWWWWRDLWVGGGREGGRSAGVWCLVVIAGFERRRLRLLEASAKEAEKTVRQERTAGEGEGWHWRWWVRRGRPANETSKQTSSSDDLPATVAP